MTFVYSRLADNQYVSDSAGAIVTNPAGQKTYVRQIFLHNSSSASVGVQLYRVPDNSGAIGTAGVSNQIFSKTLIVDETVVFEFRSPGIMLEDENDTLQAVAATASAVTISVDGGYE